MHACAIETAVICARIIVIAGNGDVTAGARVVAEVSSAGIVIIAADESVCAEARDAGVICARITIVTVDGREGTAAIHAGIIGAGVKVIAQDGGMVAAKKRVAKVNGAAIVVIARERNVAADGAAI